LLVDITVADVAMCGGVRTTATVVDVIGVWRANAQLLENTVSQ
jgi:hypothetical protein